MTDVLGLDGLTHLQTMIESIKGDERVVFPIDLEDTSKRDIATALQDNLVVFKCAADCLTGRLDILIPSWDGLADLSNHQNEMVASTYRAWCRARLGMHATLEQMARNNRVKSIISTIGE